MKRITKVAIIALGVLMAVMFVGGSRIASAEQPPVNVGTPLPPNWADYPWEYQHKVRDGEFLYMLAGYYYRDGRKWNWIYEQNRDIITNPNKIRPGTILIIKLPRNWEPIMPYSTWYVRMREQYSGSGTGGVSYMHTGEAEAATTPEEKKK